MSTTPIVSADQICRALEEVLTQHLTSTMTGLGFTAPTYGPVKSWQQVPTVRALASAKLPAGAIVSPGLVQPPKRVGSRGGYEVIWRMPVGIYERGTDHDDTAARIRNWCAGIRITVLRNKGLGGVAKSLAWVGEDYAQRPEQNTARTLAAGVVTFDVTVELLATSQLPGLPEVTTTPTSLSVQ